LADILLVHGAQGKTIVFTETKREAEELVNSDKIFQNMAALHGDISQM
jgi:superfamily II DNA/RNA helicase